MNSITIAAPAGDSTYSYSRTMSGSSSELSTTASARNISVNSRSPSRSGRRYLIATRTPDASCTASTTSPNPPEPSAFSPVYPGTSHSAIKTLPLRASAWPARPGLIPVSDKADGRPVTDVHQQLTTTAVEAVHRSGPRTCKVTVRDALPWPLPSTATVTYTACCPAMTDWFNG